MLLTFAVRLMRKFGPMTSDSALCSYDEIPYPSVPFVQSPYSCDGPTPVIEFETIDDRHPVTLTPAG